MYKIIATIRCCLVASSLVVFVGCGPNGPETAEVTGRVMIGDQPVPLGRIDFYPETGRPSTGVVQPDGTFNMTYLDREDGCVPGEHVVTVKATETSDRAPGSFEEELQGGVGSSGEVRWLVDPKFADRNSSPLRATVASGTNEFTFEVHPPTER